MSRYQHCPFFFITWNWKCVFDRDVPFIVFDSRAAVTVCSSLCCCLSVSLDSLWRTGMHFWPLLSTAKALQGWFSTVVVVLFVFSFPLTLSSKKKIGNQGDGCFLAWNENVVLLSASSGRTLSCWPCLLHLILTCFFQIRRDVDPGVIVCSVSHSCSSEMFSYYLLYSSLICSNSKVKCSVYVFAFCLWIYFGKIVKMRLHCNFN